MPPQTQTANEILENYFENTERLDVWKSIQGMKMTAKVHQGEMEIPLEFYNLKYGRSWYSTNTLMYNQSLGSRTTTPLSY